MDTILNEMKERNQQLTDRMQIIKSELAHVEQQLASYNDRKDRLLTEFTGISQAQYELNVWIDKISKLEVKSEQEKI